MTHFNEILDLDRSRENRPETHTFSLDSCPGSCNFVRVYEDIYRLYGLVGGDVGNAQGQPHVKICTRVYSY